MGQIAATTISPNNDNTWTEVAPHARGRVPIGDDLNDRQGGCGVLRDAASRWAGRQRPAPGRRNDPGGTTAVLRRRGGPVYQSARTLVAGVHAWKRLWLWWISVMARLV